MARRLRKYLRRGLSSQSQEMKRGIRETLNRIVDAFSVQVLWLQKRKWMYWRCFSLGNFLVRIGSRSAHEIILQLRRCRPSSATRQRERRGGKCHTGPTRRFRPRMQFLQIFSPIKKVCTFQIVKERHQIATVCLHGRTLRHEAVCRHPCH